MTINHQFLIFEHYFSIKFIPLVIGLLLLTGSLNAQKSGSAFRSMAIQYDQKQQFDSGMIYYDSAFHQYVIQKHYASATIAYRPMEQYLSDSGYVDSTLYYMRVVFDSTKTMSRYRNNKLILDLKKSLAKYYFDKKNIDSTKSVLNNVLPAVIRNYGRRSSQNSELYRMQSLIDFFDGKISEAAKWMKLSIETNSFESKMGEMWIEYLEYGLLLNDQNILNELNKFRRNFTEKKVILDVFATLQTYNGGQLEQALKQFSSIEFKSDSTTSAAVILKYNYVNSLLLLEKGEFDESLAIAKKYLPLVQKNYPVSHPISADYHKLICRIYYEKSDYGAAREFIEKSIYGMDRLLEKGHPLKAESYYEYSRLLSALESYDQSYTSLDTAINITQQYREEEGIFLARCYNQKGILFFHKNQMDSAVTYLQKAWKILDRKLPNKQHIYLAKVFNDLGKVYQYQEIDQNSIRDYLRSLRIYRNLLGTVHPHLGTGYYNVGTLYAKNGDYYNALKNYQISLVSNIFGFTDTTIVSNPQLDNTVSDFILLQSLTGKVEALENYYDQTLDFELLTAALDTYNLIANLIDKLRTGYISEESKRFLGEKTSYLYEHAMQLCMRMAEISRSASYLENAFFFSEKSRAGILLSGIKDANAKKVAGVPDSLLAREKELIQLIADKEIELFDELNKGTRARRSVVETYQNQLFNLKNSYSDFILFLEKEYHSYFQLKYDSYSASVDDIQKNILNPVNKKDKKQYHILEYFIGQESLYIFHIDKDTFQLFINKKPENFDQLVKGLRNSILYNSEEVFISSSQELFDLLIPIPIEKKMHLMIVPDGLLSYIPFESLLPEYDEKPLRKQKYLINQASVSYSYSLTLSVEMAKTPYDYSANNNSFTGFAPVFNNRKEYKVLSSDKQRTIEYVLADSTNHSNNYKTLLASEQELSSIYKKVAARKFQSNAYFFNSASKNSLFDSTSLNSRFLHFATHGILDEHRPQFSGIVFTDSTKSELLTLGEIYGFNTKAELVILSACETGLGQLLQGEGLVGFSRGFFFSGSKFIIVSLWEVGDESTSEMAVNFYSRYAKKKKQDIYKSFQKARLKVIKNKKYDILSDWFPFVLIGMH